jgi:hypothetical protein
MPDDEEPARTVPAGDELSWRVNSRLTIVKFAAAVDFLLAAVAFLGDPVGLTVALVAAAALTGFAVRDLVAPVRLAADPTGVTVVTGFNGRRRLPWAEIDSVRVDNRRRFGVRSQLLEIDTGETLHLFSGYELSAPCEDVARELDELRRRHIVA